MKGTCLMCGGVTTSPWAELKAFLCWNCGYTRANGPAGPYPQFPRIFDADRPKEIGIITSAAGRILWLMEKEIGKQKKTSTTRSLRAVHS